MLNIYLHTLYSQYVFFFTLHNSMFSYLVHSFGNINVLINLKQLPAYIVDNLWFKDFLFGLNCY